MLYLIGLGITGDITCEGKKILGEVDKVFLESYTMPWNYKEIKEKIENASGKEVELIERERVESNFLIKKAEEMNVALLVGGDVFSATTHISLLEEARKKGIKIRAIHNSSIFSAIAKIGLSIYKFGQTTTISFWRENYRPVTPLDKIKKNYENKMHTLVLLDIEGERHMHAKEGIELLEEMQKMKGRFIEEIISISRLGFEDERIMFSSFSKMLRIPEKEFGRAPFCLVIPSEMNEIEREFVMRYRV